MKKSDLLAMIAHVPDDADIRIYQPSHDYWHTSLAIDPSSLDVVKIKHSEYHDCDAVDDTDDADDFDEEHVPRVVYLLQ